MITVSIISILTRVRNNEISINEAEAQVKLLRFKEISDIARIDDDRQERTGIPEAILAEGKSSGDLATIVAASLTRDVRILITRVSDDQLRELESRIEVPYMVWNERARTLVCGTAPIKKTGGRVGIITAGTADIPVAEEARVAAEEMGCDVDLIYDAGAAGIAQVARARQRSSRCSSHARSSQSSTSTPVLWQARLQRVLRTLPLRHQ